MEIHYNAFISYRHHPDDIRVAEEIHKGLERFKVPKAIRKRSTGPMRLFRDKEELPITSHLTDDIGLALENSDYLIVICSPHTKESVWVQREIETFLKSHSRDKVLTVLAAGEPYDVIPEILLHEDVVDPLTGQIVRREIEPLSCDWRMKKRKAIREELPRLAAPLLHCAYDELRQRQRQYRMRRTIAAFSVALAGTLALAVYFIHTSIQIQKANDDLHAANVQIQAANVQIQDNLDQALRNQSQYLASSSTERMDAGDRLKAIALALEALPSEENQRPYLASAEYALSTALSTYEKNEMITAQGAYAADNLVKKFALNGDGSQIYLLDNRNTLTVWDVDIFQKLYTLDLSKHEIQEIYVTPQGNLVLLNNFIGSNAICVDLQGNELWKVDSAKDLAFLNDRSVTVVGQYDYQGLHQLQFLDTDTGRSVRDPLVLERGENNSHFSSFLQREYTSGDPLIMEFYGDHDLVYVVLADMETESWKFVKTIDTSMEAGPQWIDTAGVIQNGNVVVMCGDGSGFYNGTVGTMEVTGKDRADVWCFDSETGQLLWETEIVTYSYTSNSTIKPIPETDHVLLQNGNTFMVCDSTTGQEIFQNQTSAMPRSVKVNKTNVIGVLENGDYYIFNVETGTCSAMNFLDGNVTEAEVNNGFFIHTPLSRQVIAYWTDSEEDSAGKLLEDCTLTSTVRDHHPYGDYVAVKTYKELMMVNARQQKQLWRTEAEYSWEALGFSEDGREYWMCDRYEDWAAAYSVADGTRRDVVLPSTLGEGYTRFASLCYMGKGKLSYILKTEETEHLLQVDLQTGETLKELPLKIPAPEDPDHYVNYQILLMTDSYAWVYRDDGVLFVVNLEDGNGKLLADGFTVAPPLVFHDDENLVMTGVGHELYLTTPGGATIQRIYLEDRKAVSMYGYHREVLVLCDDGDLYRYDRQGNLLSQTTLHIFNTFGSDAASKQKDPGNLAWWDTGDGNLVINAFRAGNIVDCENWENKAFIPYLLSYHPDSNVLMTALNYDVMAYPRYSTQQQIQRAREKLGTYQLTEADREYYGLNDE